MKKIYLTALLLIGLIVGSNAQTAYMSLNWDITKTAGNTSDYIEEIGYRGASLELGYFIGDNITIGGFFAWYTLDDKIGDGVPYEFHDNGVTGHVSGTQARYLNIFPVLINSQYFIDSGSNFKPYVGFGMGSVYTEQRTDFGLNSFYADSWGFAAQPEIGAYIPFGYSGTGLNVALRYLYGSSAGELDSLSMFSFAIGFGFMN